MGVSDGKAADANSSLSAGASDTFDTLLKGVAGGIEGLSSFVFFLAMTVLSLFFLLKDGPTIRRWAEEHMGVPMPVAQTVTGSHPAVAAGLLLRRHDRRDVQRRPGGRRRAADRRSDGRHDRRRHLPRGLHPLHRGLERRGVLGPHRPRRIGPRGGGSDGRHPDPLERAVPADRAADRLRRRAGHPPARGAGRDDRRRSAVRPRRADPGRSTDLGRPEDLGGPERQVRRNRLRPQLPHEPRGSRKGRPRAGPALLASPAGSAPRRAPTRSRSSPSRRRPATRR